jgi:glucose-6-phosphate 1-dehydrogenase
VAERGGARSDLLVIFGITGDLACKMTFRALYRLEHRKLLQCPIVGVAHDEMSGQELAKRAREAISEAGESRRWQSRCSVATGVGNSRGCRLLTREGLT